MDYCCAYSGSPRFRDFFPSVRPVYSRDGVWLEFGAGIAACLDSWHDWLLVGNSMQTDGLASQGHEHHSGEAEFLLRKTKERSILT